MGSYLRAPVGPARDAQPEKDQKKAQRVRGEVSDTADIMRENLQKVRERGDKINDVQLR